MSADLKRAIAGVEVALKAAEAEIGPTTGGYADSAWFARQRETMTRCGEHLTETLGARINDRWNGCSVKIAGVTSTCTGGLAGALRNWMTAARRRLDA